jgi:hypothetical protein
MSVFWQEWCDRFRAFFALASVPKNIKGVKVVDGTKPLISSRNAF